MKRKRMVGLVVLFNHNYEKNITVIKKLYKGRFDKIKIIMPFYYGDEPDVISVFGNSFNFQSFIAQSRKELEQMGCDDYLIIGDDLLLNPELNSDNLHEKLSIAEGSFYIDAVENVSECNFYRPLIEATKFSPYYPGLDSSANRFVPSFEEAYKILEEKSLISSVKLSRWKPFFEPFKRISFKNLYANYKILKGRVWHMMKMLQYRIKPVSMPYPYVFGYSDIVLIPSERLTELCKYLEVFASWRMFVEMAIPTAIMLLPDSKVCFASETKYKTGNVWYPQNPQHFKSVSGAINELLQKSSSADQLEQFFPREYLYLHPVKLSKYNES